MFGALMAAKDPGRSVVIVPVANMYSKPSVGADVVSQARYAMTVDVIGKRGGFSRIRTPDQYEGWASSKTLRRLKKGQAYPAGNATVSVESLHAHLYPDASVTRHAPIITVPFETRLERIDTAAPDGRWLQVRLPDGKTAFLQKGDTIAEPGKASISELIELARRFLGLPYTWGGTTSHGFDCSGYTQMLCRRGGVDIPRDAGPQFRWDRMQSVEKPGLRAGDLLYFGPSQEKITHTGFYLGDGQFIHATTHEKPVVQISKLDEEHWTKIYQGARRWTK
jgi:cell wall-associated NlpC family hydrolase